MSLSCRIGVHRFFLVAASTAEPRLECSRCGGQVSVGWQEVPTSSTVTTATPPPSRSASRSRA